MTDAPSPGFRPKPSGLAAKQDLKELGSAAGTPPEQLDLVHVTTVGWGIQIIEAGQIETRDCKVFGKPLVYTFVARPAYRSADSDEKSDNINYFPCVFVISPTKLPTPFHIYPFDTGAAATGRYGDAADKHVYRSDYELGQDIAATRRHIAWAFGNNEAYFDARLRIDLRDTLPVWRSAAQAYLRIAGLAAIGSNRPDRRASSIEVAYQQHVPLHGHVNLVILPQQILEDSGVRNDQLFRRLNEQGLAWETYDWRPCETPESFLDEITRIVKRHLQNAGKL